MEEAFIKLENIVAGGALMASLLFTKKMYFLNEGRIKKLEEASDALDDTMHKIDKELIKISTQLEYISKHLKGK